jgi:glycine cleavage system H protein
MTMAADFPEDLGYTESDEWVRRDGDEVTSGITSFAAEQLGDIVYLQLPDIGRRLAKGESFGEIESVKAVSDLYAPVSGEVTAVNEELDRDPGLVNHEPYGRGWIIKVRATAPEELDSLLDAAAYERSTAERH